VTWRGQRSRPPRQLSRFLSGLRGQIAQSLLLGSALVACNGGGALSEPRLSAEFGIFYGGQVQERDELPLELDRTRQLQGFRLQLDPAPQRPLEVRWELGRPGVGRALPDSQGRRARPRKVQLGQARWRPGEGLFEQTLPFSPGDPVGLWNMRVLLDGQVVIERPFLVYDAAQRSQRLSAHADRDAGL
jgi:hypothetical protein